MNQQAQVSLSGNTLSITGAVRFDTVAGLKQQLDRLSLADVRQVDCSGIVHSDSAAVSLLLYLLKGNTIALRGVNASLQGLLDLYAVAPFFTDQASASEGL